MNIRPTVEFDDKYQNAKTKILECIHAINALTPQQREQLANEVLEISGMKIVFEQFVRNMNNRRID